ncbi:hypothetical protein HYR54_14790 [Candidatus Acetothermia bacterium]|nr:hypothetical protein [Candidatus Acetothermia bacterium]
MRKKLLYAVLISAAFGVSIWLVTNWLNESPTTFKTKRETASRNLITAGVFELPAKSDQTTSEPKSSQEAAEIKERLLQIQGDLKNLTKKTESVEQRLERIDGTANLGLIVGAVALVMTLLIVLRILK